MDLTQSRINSFRRTVYRHFERHGRDLPWRNTSDPYHILVSEIMLQQTQVDRVVDFYRRFLTRFPDVSSLASASTHDLLAAWQGLGYNRRARNLQRCAAAIIADHAGRVPDDPDNLVCLPGIGKATAASIAAFAFNRPTIFIETNIRTVFIHHFFGNRQGVTDSELRPLVRRTLDRRRPAKWYSALMDYGVYLKKRFGNPSRRSAHHVGQGKFEGSDRQIRGEILRRLLKDSEISEAVLISALGAEKERAKRIISQLVHEDFIVRVGNHVRIAS
ncbi:MAG: A/G-specific adenine glycosylase [Chitinivibrionales bacterium]|nr:A/G-specific adenine glycosylase [Chitinivibrionales bacterium]MBD3356932.1 A/G-specific adenine glycosylase [Chitinivibrionales bacterium]